MRASTLALRAGPLILIGGMSFGIYMAASTDHTAASAHAHLNLLGFAVSMIMGLVYRLNAAIDASRLAVLQIVLWLASVLVMFPSLVLLFYGNPQAEIGASISSLTALISMILFAVNAFRITGTPDR